MDVKRFLSGALCAVLLLALCPAAAADAPREISSAEELSLLRDTPDGDFVLTADIDMTGVDWQPIAFSGTLDGGGHTIYNLTVTSLGADRAETVDGNDKTYDTALTGFFSVLDGVTSVTFKVLTEKPYLTRAFDKDENQILIKGYEKKAFSGCFHFERENIPGYAPTCVKAGLTDGEKCKKCGEITVKQKEISALGHKEKNGICTVCGERIVTLKPTVKDGCGYAVDYDKKTVTLFPNSASALSVYEFRSNFNEELTFSPDAVTIKNALKFTCGDEYTVILKGDVNDDGGITASDARAILRISAKLENPDDIMTSAADINSDGKITSSEARTVLRFSARLTDTLQNEK